jgi:hypothetical protein
MFSYLVYGPGVFWLQATRTMIVALKTTIFDTDICIITIPLSFGRRVLP